MFTHSLTFPVLSGGGLHYEGDKHLLEQLKAVGARASTGVIFHSKRTDHSWGWGWGGGWTIHTAVMSAFINNEAELRPYK